MKTKYEITIDIDDLHGDCEISLADGENMEIVDTPNLESVAVTFRMDKDTGEVYAGIDIISADTREHIKADSEKEMIGEL